MLPNLVYIGPDKAGSTWLHDLMRWHPEIYAPVVKELFFFDRYFQRGLPWYSKHYAPAAPDARVRVDISHDYLFNADVPARLREVLGPEIKLMVTLREPLERAVSAYLFMVRQGRVRSSFEDAIGSVDELVDHGRYAHHLTPFLACFPREQIHTPLFDDLVADPNRFAGELFRFLGVQERDLPAELLERRLVAAKPRSFAVARVARRAGVAVRAAGGERLVTMVKSSRGVGRALYSELGQGDAPQISDDLRARLRDRFASSVHDVDQLLGTSCAARWGYA